MNKNCEDNLILIYKVVSTTNFNVHIKESRLMGRFYSN